MRTELEKQLLGAAKTGDLPESLTNAIFEDYSQKIALDINPIDYPSAPFIIAVLNSYSAAIEKQFPGAEMASHELVRKTGSACIRIPLKGGGSQ